MKDPERLLQHGATPEELTLLRAGIAEEPGPEGKQRLAAALGLGVGVWGTAATASSKAAAPTIKAASQWSAKWLAALVGSAALGGVALVAVLEQPEPVADSKPAAVPAVVRDKAPEAAPAPANAAAEHEVEALAVESLTPEPAGAKAGAAVRHPGAPDSASIAREIEAVDEVRVQVSRGQTAAALAALSKYRKEFPRGVLRQEATLLQIEALAKGGNLAAAREIGQRFLRDHPRTPHEKRVRALLGDTP